MAVNSPSIWWSRGLTFALAAAVAASAVYWVLRWPQPSILPPVTSAAELPAPDLAALGRLLGQATVAAAPASSAGRYALTGVLAGPGPKGGAALITVDGRPARPVRVGARVDDEMFLQSVVGRRAVLAAGAANAPPALTLEMPAPPR